MISKMSKVLILAGCLVAAGTASAADRDVVVPVIAGAAVGAVLMTALSDSGGHHHRHHYAPQPVRYAPAPPPHWGPQHMAPHHGPQPHYDHGPGRWNR